MGFPVRKAARMLKCRFSEHFLVLEPNAFRFDIPIQESVSFLKFVRWKIVFLDHNFQFQIVFQMSRVWFVQGLR